MNRGEAIALLNRSLPPDQLRQVLTAFGQHQVGDIGRWDGEQWELLTDPEAPDEGSAAFRAVYDLLSALDTLDGIETSDIPLPGFAEIWRETLEQASQAYNELEGLMEGWGIDLKKAVDREREGQNEVLRDAPPSGVCDPNPPGSDASPPGDTDPMK